MPQPPDRYVITRPHPGSGIGSNLQSLAGAIWYGERTGRAVVVDWRGSSFLKDQSANYFSEFFETPDQIQGVPVLYAPAPGVPDNAPQVGVGVARSYLSAPSPEPAIVIRDYHPLERLDAKGSVAQQFWRLKGFYRYIRPRPFVQQEIDRFAAEHFEDAFMIGVNLSSGNGEFDKGQYYDGRVDMDILSKDAQLLRKVEQARRLAVRGLPKELGRTSRIFFATDAYKMHYLLKRVPNAVTRRTVFPPPGVGRVYCDYNDPGYTDRDAIVDAIADMFLLARCDALVRNGSAFNTYAYTVTNGFSGNVRHIESLYARYWLRAIGGRVRRLLRR